MSRGCIKEFLGETVAYVFTDILFLDSRSPYFFKKKGLKLLKDKSREIIPKHGELKHKPGLSVAKRIIIFEIASHFN